MSVLPQPATESLGGAQVIEHFSSSKGDNMANEELNKEIESLKKDLKSVRDDLGRLREVGTSAAEDAASTARERLEQETNRLLERLQAAAQDAGGRGRRVLDDVEHEMEERPMTTLLASFGIGVVVGWIFSRK